jgi:FkbM family methyltransferase
MQDAFVKLIRNGDVVYDVGAFAGYYSLLCGLLVGSTGRVFAFEPHPLNCDSIERQLRLNPTLNVTLLPFALSDLNARVCLDTHAGRSQTHISNTGDLSAEAKSIDNLVETGVLPPPNLIKIDVEGHEEGVLRGGMKTIASHRPIVLCDHNDGSTFETVRDLLTPLGYEVTNGSLVTSIPL